MTNWRTRILLASLATVFVLGAFFEGHIAKEDAGYNRSSQVIQEGRVLP